MLTASGEVCQCVDDNQFASGQSQDKCGPEAIALFWHSTKPGITNPYNSAEIHAMAHDDYQRFIGPDSTMDHNGTSKETLYAMLKFHRFGYAVGPDNAALGWIRGWLDAGYPVILGITESSVHDKDVSGSPYNWNTAGLTHIVLATGNGSGDELLIRDTANIGLNGIVRPGPRHYVASELQTISTTMVVPSWMPVPTSTDPPVPTPVPPTVDYRALVKSLVAQLQEAVSHL